MRKLWLLVLLFVGLCSSLSSAAYWDMSGDWTYWDCSGQSGTLSLSRSGNSCTNYDSTLPLNTGQTVSAEYVFTGEGNSGGVVIYHGTEAVGSGTWVFSVADMSLYMEWSNGCAHASFTGTPKLCTPCAEPEGSKPCPGAFWDTDACHWDLSGCPPGSDCSGPPAGSEPPCTGAVWSASLCDWDTSNCTSGCDNPPDPNGQPCPEAVWDSAHCSWDVSGCQTPPDGCDPPALPPKPCPGAVEESYQFTCTGGVKVTARRWNTDACTSCDAPEEGEKPCPDSEEKEATFTCPRTGQQVTYKYWTKGTCCEQYKDTKPPMPDEPCNDPAGYQWDNTTCSWQCGSGGCKEPDASLKPCDDATWDAKNCRWKGCGECDDVFDFVKEFRDKLQAKLFPYDQLTGGPDHSKMEGEVSTYVGGTAVRLSIQFFGDPVYGSVLESWRPTLRAVMEFFLSSAFFSAALYYLFNW